MSAEILSFPDPLASLDSSDRLGLHMLCAIQMDGDSSALVAVASALETRAVQVAKRPSVQAQWGAKLLREEAVRLRVMAREIGELA